MQKLNVVVPRFLYVHAHQLTREYDTALATNINPDMKPNLVRGLKDGAH